MARAFGKVIVLGEHAVVYGEPALAGALDRGCEVTVAPHPEGPFLLLNGQRFVPNDPGAQRDDKLAQAFALALDRAGRSQEKIAVTANFDVPTSAGLGSSAALAVALCRALNESVTDEALDQQSNAIEQIFHGTPSGLDAACAKSGALGLYTRTKGLQPIKAPAFKLVIANTGVSRSTEKQVARVGEKSARIAACSHVMHAIGELSHAGAEAIAQGNLTVLGELMNMNHGLLQALGVSHPVLDSLVHCALAEGAIGAKLTGAGGGGCNIVIAHGREQIVADALAPISKSVTIAALGGR